jgi:putrescine transport system substrate-binding protein
VIGTALIYLGRDPNSEAPEDLAAAGRAADEDPAVRQVRHSSQYINDLANGEICLALGWSGDVLQAQARGAEAGTPVEVKPTRSRRRARSCGFDMLAIPADAKHPKNAHEFIDHLLRPESSPPRTATTWPTRTATWRPAAGVRGRPHDRGIYPTDEVKRSSTGPRRVAPVHRLLTRAWTRFKTGK